MLNKYTRRGGCMWVKYSAFNFIQPQSRALAITAVNVFVTFANQLFHFSSHFFRFYIFYYFILYTPRAQRFLFFRLFQQSERLDYAQITTILARVHNALYEYHRPQRVWATLLYRHSLLLWNQNATSSLQNIDNIQVKEILKGITALLAKHRTNGIEPFAKWNVWCVYHHIKENSCYSIPSSYAAVVICFTLLLFYFGIAVVCSLFLTEFKIPNYVRSFANSFVHCHAYASIASYNICLSNAVITDTYPKHSH